ncbi:30S ribosomal protein S16 [bacterium]|nr:30S ribosomal protein S16 [bacterium]
MLKIRLKRTGRKKSASYRIAVMDSAQPRDGRTIDELGFYDPKTNPSTFKFDEEKAKAWIAKGAQPTDTVEHYFVKAGIMKPHRKGSHKPSTVKKEEKKEE